MDADEEQVLIRVHPCRSVAFKSPMRFHVGITNSTEIQNWEKLLLFFPNKPRTSDVFRFVVDKLKRSPSGSSLNSASTIGRY